MKRKYENYDKIRYNSVLSRKEVVVMEFKKESNRIYLENENGEMVAEITFPNISDKVVDINRTFVDDSLRGQGIAGKLMEELVEELKNTGKHAVPTCSYAAKWFEKNKEYDYLLSK